jgi:mannose-6-phosphate isomerase-like protein (cupin superfamily)
MKYRTNDIGGTVVKQDDRYTVKDNTELKNLIVSSTDLNPGKSTSGHKHEGQEEVYHFVRGTGRMELNDEHFDVYPGDYVLIKDGVFHRVHNTGLENLYFICVFEGKRNH